MADTSFQTLFNKLVHKFEGASVSTNAPSKKNNRVQFSDFLKTRYPQTALPPTPEPIDQYKPKQINSLYDVLSHTYQTAAYTSFRNSFKYISQNPQDAYYIKKYGLENYFKNVGITEYNWTKNRQVWNTFINEHLTQPFKMLTDESVPFRTRMSNYGNHLLTAGLTSFGETADILANIVKAALPNKLTHYEEKYPELKGTSKTERIFAGVFGLDAAKDIPLSDAFKYLQRPAKLRTSVDSEKYYKQIADALQKNETNINKTFSRYTFDWDVNLDDDPDKTNVGEFIINMAGEIVSDPLNILEMAGSIADAVGGNKAVLKALTKNGDEVYNKALPDLIESGVLKWDTNTSKWFGDLWKNGVIDDDTYWAFRRIGYDVARNSKDEALVKASLKDILLNQELTKGIFKKRQDMLNIGALRDALYGTNRDEFIDAFKTYINSKNFSVGTLQALYNNPGVTEILGGKIFDTLSDTLVHKTNFKILTAIHGVAEGADFIDNAIIKLAGMPVMTPVVMLVKNFGGKFIKYIGATTTNKLSKHQLITPDGADLGVKIYKLSEIKEELRKTLEPFTLANAGISKNTSVDEIVTDASKEIIGKSVHAQVAWFNNSLETTLKQYSKEALEDSAKLTEMFETIKKNCNIFVQASGPEDTVTNIQDFIKYLDKLVIDNPELQTVITSDSIKVLEQIAEFEAKSDEILGMLKDSNALRAFVDNAVVFKDSDDLSKQLRDILGWDSASSGRQEDLFSFIDRLNKQVHAELDTGGIKPKKAKQSDTLRNILRNKILTSKSPDEVYDALQLLKQLDPVFEKFEFKPVYAKDMATGNLKLITYDLITKTEYSKYAVKVSLEDALYIETFLDVIDSSLKMFDTFDFEDKINNILRQGFIDDINRLGPQNVKRINTCFNGVERTFNGLNDAYKKLYETCKNIKDQAIKQEVHIISRDVSESISFIKSAYIRLNDAFVTFRKYSNRMLETKDYIERIIKDNRDNAIVMASMFSFIREPHLTVKDTFSKLNELFKNSIFTKMHGISDSLYDKTIKEIRQAAASDVGKTNIIYTTVQEFIDSSEDFLKTFEDFANTHPEVSELFNDSDFIKLFKSEKGSINFDEMTFVELDEFIKKVNIALSNFEEPFKDVQEAFNTTLRDYRDIYAPKNVKKYLKRTGGPEFFEKLKKLNLNYLPDYDAKKFNIKDISFKNQQDLVKFLDIHPLFYNRCKQILMQTMGIDEAAAERLLGLSKDYTTAYSKIMSVPVQKAHSTDFTSKLNTLPIAEQESFIALRDRAKESLGTVWPAFMQTLEDFGLDKKTFKNSDYSFSYEKFLDNKDWSDLFPKDKAKLTVVNAGEMAGISFYADTDTLLDNIRQFKQNIRATQKLYTSELPFFSDLDKDNAWVQFRLERLTEMFYTLKNPITMEFEGIQNGTSFIGQVLQSLEKIEIAQAQDPEIKGPIGQLIEKVNDWLSTRSYVESLVTDAELQLDDARVFRAFMETLMNYTQSDLSNLTDPIYQRRFYQNMRLNLDGKFNTKRESLDAFRLSNLLNSPEADKYITSEELKKYIIDRGHVDPGADTLILRLKTLLDDNVRSTKDQINEYLEHNRKNGRRAKFFDIETSDGSNAGVMTTNRYSGQITQLSVSDYETGETKVFRLNLPGVPRDESNEITYVYVDSIGELFLRFDDELKDTDILLGMNSAQFDVPFIRDHWINWNSESFRTSNAARIFYSNDLQSKGGGHFDIYHTVQLNNGIIPPNTDNSTMETVFALLTNFAAKASDYNIKNLKLLDSYNFIAIATELDKTIQDILSDRTIAETTYSLRQLGVLSDWASSFSERINTFKNDLYHVDFKNMLIRDLTHETVSNSKLEELYRISKMTSEQMNELLRQEAHLTDEEFELLKRTQNLYESLLEQGSMSKAELDVLFKQEDFVDPHFKTVLDKIKDAWVRRMYFYGYKADEIVHTEDMYEVWQKEFNMSDPRNLQRMFVNPDGYLPVNYKRLFTPGDYDIKVKDEILSLYNKQMLNELFTMADEKTLYRLRNANKRIRYIVENRIKQPDAILNGLGIFKNKDDLVTQTKALVQAVALNDNYTGRWVRYIDLSTFDKIDSVEYWFSLWYAVVSDIHTKSIAETNEYLKTIYGNTLPVFLDPDSSLSKARKLQAEAAYRATLDPNYNPLIDDFNTLEYVDIVSDIEKYIGDRVFALQKISENVFDNKDFYYLLKDEDSLGHPLYDLFETEMWQSLTGTERLAKASVAIDYIGRGGAKEYARQALVQKFRKVINEINSLSTATDGISPSQKERYVKTFARHMNDISGALNEQFLANSIKSPEALISDLLFNNGVRVLHLKNAVPDSDYSTLCKALLAKSEEYAKYGIQMTYDNNLDSIFLTLAKDDDIAFDMLNTGNIKINYLGRDYTAPEIPLILMEDTSGIIPKEHLDLYNEIIKKHYSLFKSNYMGRAFNQDDLDDWLKLNIPEYMNYSKNSLDLSKLSGANFYKGTNLRMIDVYDPATITYDPTTMEVVGNIDYSKTLHSFFNNYQHMLNVETGQDLFFDFMLSPTYGMGFKNTEGIFKGLSEKEILQVVKNTDDFVPVGIVKDNSIQGFHVVRLQINTVKDVQQAGELNAILVPYQVYSSCFDEINNTLEAAFRAPVTAYGKNILENKGVEAYVKTKPLYYARMGLWMYKVGSLIAPGTWIRNLIDSNLKAAIDTGDPIGTIRNNFRAMDMMHRYNETIKQFQILYPDSPRNITSSMLKESYKKFVEYGITPKMSQDEFLFLHNFIINGPSTGETKVLRDWFSSASTFSKMEDAGLLQRFANKMLAPMGFVETNARLGQYLTLMKQGVTKTEAFTRISNTAFDYNIKSNVDKFIEYFLPFFNFQKLNAMYWAEAFYKHPMAIRMLNDFTKYSWQTFEYDGDYYMSEKSKAYHMMNGNLMIDPTAGLVLKLNPSYMDAINWLYDPANSVIDSLLAPLQNYVNGVMDNDSERFVQQQIQDGSYIIRVGKYKGWTVNEVFEKNPGYLQFALDKDWFKTYDRAGYISAMLKLSGTPLSITFGDKFNGQPVKVLLKDENRAYAQYLLTQKWFKDMYKPVYDYLVLNKVYEDPVMPFGKFEGKKISEVPDWYFDYIMKNDWMYENYGYLSDAIIEQRNTILPMSEIDFDSNATLADASGKIAAGMFIEDNEQANIYFQSILDMFNKSSTYPLVGPTIQKYITSLFKNEQENTPYDSSSQTNYTRLSKQGTITEARLGALFPDVFGSVTLYERHKQESAIDYSKIPPHISKYRPQDYNDRRNRHYNYYRSARAERYRIYHKHVKASLDVAQLRLNIAQLHLGV